MKTLPPVLAAALLLGSWATSRVVAEDWPRWRGPRGDGLTTETDWTDKALAAGAAQAIVWRAQVGTGFSAVSVAEGRACTMGHADGFESIICLDAGSGRVIWKHSYPAPLDDKLFEGGPTATPLIEDGRVYSLGRQGELHCLSLSDGRVIWSIQLASAAQVRVPGWGFSGSPVSACDLLLLNAGDAGVAVDKHSGKIVWKSADKDAGYAAPVVLQPAGPDSAGRVVFASGRSIVSVEATTGKELWRYPWITRYGINAADPIARGDQLFVSSGYSKGGAMLQIAQGREPQLLWKTKELATHLNGAVLIGDRLFGFDGDAAGGDEEGGADPRAPASSAKLRCLDWNTGRVLWTDQRIGFGSLIAAGDRLIILSERGELLIAPVSDVKFEPTTHAHVLEGRCWTAPALSGGKLYCRNAAGQVVCLDLRPGR
jgi:outer membrane protein assembly factor BamB